MPVHLNKIGDYQFLDIEGAFHLRQQELELIERVGVDGTGLRRLGERGKPFEVVTTNYETSFDTAEDMMDLYLELVGGDPVNVIRYSQTEGNFFVLQVRERQPPFAIFNSLGGLVGGEECCHIVSWTLLAGP